MSAWRCQTTDGSVHSAHSHWVPAVCMAPCWDPEMAGRTQMEIWDPVCAGIPEPRLPVRPPAGLIPKLALSGGLCHPQASAREPRATGNALPADRSCEPVQTQETQPRQGQGCRGREPDVPRVQPACPGKAHGGGRIEIILGNSATKLLVLSAFFLPQNRFEQKENHRASERLREKN